MQSVIPEWFWTAILLTAICPATLMYDIVWGLVKRRQLARYLMEAACDVGCVSIAILLASVCGAPGQGVAMAGCCACCLSKSIALAITGTGGFYASDPQPVPEWWVAISACFFAPLLAFEVLAPLVAYLSVNGWSIG